MLSDELQALLDGPGPHPWLFNLVLPDGNLSVSKVGYASISQAVQYHGWVQSIAYPKYVASNRGGNIGPPEMSIEVMAGQALMQRLAGREREIEGGEASAVQAHPNQEPADWYTTFTGIIARVEYPRPLLVRFTLRVDDRVIQHDAPREYAQLRVDTFPKALSDSWSKLARPIYGTHDSLSYSGAGFVELYLLDKTAYIFGGILGRIMGVIRAYAQGQLLAASVWTWQYEARRGTWYTTVTLTTDAFSAIYGTQWTGADDAGKLKLVEGTKVTIDCYGLGTSPLGAGSGGVMIANPIEQLVHEITNFQIGSWRRGAWILPDRIGDYSELSAFLELLGFKGARVVSTVQTGAQQISDWLQSYGRDALVMAFWERDGKLYFRPVPLTTEDAYPAGPAASQETLALPKPGDQNTIGSVVYEFVTDDVQGKQVVSVSARDPNAQTEAMDTIQQGWGSAQ